MDSRRPFNTQKQPKRPYPYLMPVEWVGGKFFRMVAHSKVERHHCEGLKPPYLMLCNHASFIDFPMAVKATFPYRTNWVISIEEFNGREWLMRGIGGIYKRKFTSDLRVVRHILTVLKKQKGICTIYPEARYSLAGVNEQIDGALGKLAKMADVPVVLFIQKGNFLRSPQWCKSPTRDVPVIGDMVQIVTREEVRRLTAAEIQQRIEEAFVYDDYQWQYDNRIVIDSPYRAHQIHRILYQCPHCQTEFSMTSDHTRLWCGHCGKQWEMDEYGRLHSDGEEGAIFEHVPDWYRWERDNVRAEIEAGTYHFEDQVRLEKLMSSHEAFRRLGMVHMTHDERGFTLEGKLDNGDHFTFNRSVASMYSCHIEYDFKGRGDAIDLCTLEDTYFVFPLTARNVLTKLHFATEELFRKERAEKQAEKLAAQANTHQ